MERISLLILTTLLFNFCEQSSNCEQSKTYLNGLGIAHRELSENNPIDSAYVNYVRFARTFVIDSLQQDIKCFQYNFSADIRNNKAVGVVELYDKRLEIAEKSPFNDSIYYRLNQIHNLYFDSTGVYLYNRWVSDTEEEFEEDGEMFKKL